MVCYKLFPGREDLSPTVETTDLMCLQRAPWSVGKIHKRVCLSTQDWPKEVNLVVMAFFLCWFSKLLCYLICFSSLAGLLRRGQLSEHPLKVPTEAASASLSQEGGKKDQTFRRGHPERKQDSGYQVGLVGP